MKILLETFLDETPSLISLVLLERRPVIVKGYIESRILRELRFAAPHRDLYECGRNIPRTPNEVRQFITNLLEGEALSSAEMTSRCSLILAPNVERQLVNVLLSFNKGWVASCVATPQQQVIQKSDVAIYDVNEARWLNIDTSEVKKSWVKRIIGEAMAKNNEELIRAYLDLAISEVSKKASTLWRYLCAGVMDPDQLWHDLGEPDDEERDAIMALCKTEHNVDAQKVLNDVKNPTASKHQQTMQTEKFARSANMAPLELLIQRMITEQDRLKRCIELANSRIQP